MSLLPVGKHRGGPLPARTYGHDSVLGAVTGPVGFWWEYIGDLVTGQIRKEQESAWWWCREPESQASVPIPAPDELCGFKKVTKLAQTSLLASIE